VEKKIRTIRWVTFFALLTTAAVYLFPLIEWKPAIVVGGLLLVLSAAIMLTWALESWLRFLTSQAVSIDKSRRDLSVVLENQDVKFLLDTNRDLISAQSAREVVEMIMRAGISLFEATGASFVSFDEWGSSLPPITCGVIPVEGQQQWMNRLSNPATRQICRNCENREADTDCILSRDVNNNLIRVICQPICDNTREIGVINFFFKSPKIVDLSHRDLLNKLTDRATSTLDSIQKHDKEIAALRLLQSSPVNKELPDRLTDLASNLKQAMGLKSALFWISEGLLCDFSTPTIIPQLKNTHASIEINSDDPFIKDIWQSILCSQQIISLEHVAVDSNGVRTVFLAIPLVWQTERPIGLLLLVNKEPLRLNNLQKRMLQTIAGEASLLIQNSRLLVQTEYQAVLDERTRLAREIHDGLAQTLAFLKIQSVQMQNYLRTGNLTKLDEFLSSNTQTLAVAYQDARQAIDNLRSVPEITTQEWLLKLSHDFSDATGIFVDVSQLKVPMIFPPTVQAQLIRIVQEAFSNIRKHAHAHKVSLIGYVRSDEIILDIRDDGIGFEPGQIEMESRYGLVGMRERADMIGGEFQIISKQGKGTTIRISLPSGEHFR
jgi:two-component system nitrate/nitrite sensor histidine kinase NarX